MEYIVKITKYKHRMSVNIPAVLVREQRLKNYTHVIMEKLGPKRISIRGYKDGEKLE